MSNKVYSVIFYFVSIAAFAFPFWSEGLSLKADLKWQIKQTEERDEIIEKQKTLIDNTTQALEEAVGVAKEYASALEKADAEIKEYKRIIKDTKNRETVQNESENH